MLLILRLNCFIVIPFHPSLCHDNVKNDTYSGGLSMPLDERRSRGLQQTCRLITVRILGIRRRWKWQLQHIGKDIVVHIRHHRPINEGSFTTVLLHCQNSQLWIMVWSLCEKPGLRILVATDLASARFSDN